ncbi:MAG TPA: hypothetical protein VGN83_18485 [Falsiroseomonas sp.]|jgi:hypothetical protein|nr:hypothetical protein [Falsiroseomonas sp.]
MAQDAFADIVSRLQAGLLAEVAQMSGLPPIVAVKDMDELRAFWGRRLAAGVRFTRLADRADAVVQIGPHAASLWMDPAAGGYRAAYGTFLARHCSQDTALTGSGYDVDHVYNRARAIHYGYRYVRMFLVRAGPNREHGRAYEQGIGAAEKDRFAKAMKHLDAMSELKVLGLPPVRDGVLLPEHRAAAALAARTYGIGLDQAIEALLAMCGRAKRKE